MLCICHPILKPGDYTGMPTINIKLNICECRDHTTISHYHINFERIIGGKQQNRSYNPYNKQKQRSYAPSHELADGRTDNT